MLAVDAVGSGIGELVLAIAEGRSVMLILAPGSSSLPLVVLIAGLLDEVISTEGSLYLYD